MEKMEKITNNINNISIIVGGISIVITIFILALFLPFYLIRSSQYDIHMEVLNDICYSSIIPSHYQLEKIRAKGISTNCTESEIFVSTPVILGAIKDWWVVSPFYAIIYADNWQIQAVYMCGALFFMYFGVKFLFNAQVLSHFTNKGVQLLEAKFGNRRQIIMPKSNFQQQQQQQLQLQQQQQNCYQNYNYNQIEKEKDIMIK